VHPLAAIQSEYSLLYRKEAEETLAVCRELGIAFVAYSPIGRGFLTGQFHKLEDIPEGDRRRDHPRFQEGNFEKNVELVKKIEAIAAEKGCTPSQLVLAWLLAQGPEVAPIPGTKRMARVDENLGALDVPLNRSDVERISEAVPAGAAAGLRYPAPQMKGVYL
jgi:aryl-alcohol dehydrogenase-like predicted oxidoreductase